MDVCRSSTLGDVTLKNVSSDCSSGCSTVGIRVIPTDITLHDIMFTNKWFGGGSAVCATEHNKRTPDLSVSIAM